MDNHERQQRSTWGGAVSSNACSSPDQALDDAMNRFGGLSLDVGITAATEHHHRQQREQQQQQQQRLVLSGASSRSVVGVNELAMGALCVGEATVRQSFTTQEQQGRQHQQPGSQSPPNSSTPSPWGTHPQHQYAQHLPQRQHQQQLMLQPQPHGLGGGGGVHRLGDGFCAGCKGRGIGAGSTMAAAAATGGRGQDGVWRDEHGRRLYTEDEMQEAVEREGAGWRDRTTSLEADLAKMESDAREALRRAEEALAEMAEQLKASESKTYALSVHLARSNRPSHLA